MPFTFLITPLARINSSIPRGRRGTVDLRDFPEEFGMAVVAADEITWAITMIALVLVGCHRKDLEEKNNVCSKVNKYKN